MSEKRKKPVINKPLKNIRKMGNITFRSFSQAIYLTTVFFTDNGLISYASSCAFGFLFSFIPVVFLIFAIVVRILHTSPEAVTELLAKTGIFDKAFNIESMVDSLLNVSKITSVEIVMIITIFFMARRFFASSMASLRTIFKEKVEVQPLLQQGIILIGEAIFIISAAFLIIFISVLRTVRAQPVFADLLTKFPIITSNLSTIIVNGVPVVFIFAVVFFFYKQGSRSKPPLLPTLFSAGLCTLVFWSFQKLMRYFININNYNFVYGALSTIIVLLLEVWFFFLFFLYFAEFLFVYQYFDTLLLSELYVLPERDDTRLIPTMKRILFITPTSLISKKGSTVSFKKDEFIYLQGDKEDYVYYIIKGSVLIMQPNNVEYEDTGDFFGEQACLLNSSRKEEAKAVTDVQLLRIDKETFYELIDKNLKVSQKALSKISSYFSKIYGRINDNLL